jgi:2-dehydropantoate 2-reductase
MRHEDGRFHQATSGKIVLDANEDASLSIGDFFRQAGLDVERRLDMEAIQWSKLLLNLNNPINALAGIPLKEELANRSYRKILAACIEEGLKVLKAAGIPVTRVSGVPLRLVPWVLRLPNPLFSLAARSLLAIDPHARSSMWYDLEKRRQTEIEALNGEILHLARMLQVAVPVNKRIYDRLKKVEAKRAGSPRLVPSQVEFSARRRGASEEAVRSRYGDERKTKSTTPRNQID